MHIKDKEIKLKISKLRLQQEQERLDLEFKHDKELADIQAQCLHIWTKTTKKGFKLYQQCSTCDVVNASF